mmetsp:Transcript_90364/g.165780  ORF Transcript_90364/g.165780 Transcript_90364/m.165780 type:complete len:513 (+) Transcript_90364:55-1593(+)
MDPAGGDLESQGENSVLQGFLLKAPQDAVRWLIEAAGSIMSTSDDAISALKFVSALMSSSYKQKQTVVIQLIKGFVVLPATERVRITVTAMDALEAFSALKPEVVQKEQPKEPAGGVEPKADVPAADLPDIKQMLMLVKLGVVDTSEVSRMLNSLPAEQRNSVVEAAKAAAVDQGLSEDDIAFLTKLAEQPSDVVEPPTADPKSEAEKEKQKEKQSLLLKMAELPGMLAHDSPYLAQAAKVAVLQIGILKVIKTIIELITELDYSRGGGKEQQDGKQPDERNKLEELLVTLFSLQKGSSTSFFVHRVLTPGGYADQILKVSKGLLLAYDCAWLLIAVPLLELLVSFLLSACSLPLRAWLRFDSVLALLTNGAGFYIYMEYSRVYTAYQEFEEGKLGERKDEEAGRNAPFVDLELITSLVGRETLWKIGLVAVFCVLALLAGWAAMLVVSIEIFVSVFTKCGFLLVLVTFIFDLLRIASLAAVGYVVVMMYQEYAVSPLKGKVLSTASNYGAC